LLVPDFFATPGADPRRSSTPAISVVLCAWRVRRRMCVLTMGGPMATKHPPRPERAEALAWARRRVEDSFRDIYLTLVSIIQGVALGFLAESIAAGRHDLTAERAGRIVTMFLVIVVVWQEYMVGAVMFAWTPGILDSLVPFSLGLGEGLMVAAIDDDITSFLLYYACVGAVSFAAGVNYWWQARRKQTVASQMSAEVLRVHPASTAILSGIGVVFIGAMTIYSLDEASESTVATLAWAAAILPSMFLATSRLRWSKHLHPSADHHGWEPHR
jgi:hypothetical protein